MTETLPLFGRLVLRFLQFWSFVFVWDFDIRIWDLPFFGSLNR